jgi:predicted dehydrogenase
MTMHRRTFLQAGAAGLFAALGAETGRGFAANDTLNVACLGTGGRCRHLMQALRKIPNVRIAAVCDVWDVALAEGAKLADPKAERSKEFRKLLDRKDIDAVLIGSPDHWHVPMTVAACEAGKDVYVEKPLTHDLKEGQAVIDAQNKHKKVVQVGTQQRSMPQFQKAREIVKAGGIGTVRKVHLTWNRNWGRFGKGTPAVDPKSVDWKAFCGSAPEQPFDEYRFRNWRWFWDFGGGILTDLMVHFIDVAHWFLEVEHPTAATTVGDHFDVKGVWETPDTIQCLLKYPKFEAYFEGTFLNARHGAMIEFMGSDASLYVDRGRYEVIPERGGKVKAEELVLNKDGKGKGADFYDTPDGELLHLTNWVECVRSRKAANCPAEAGVSAASAAHLGNMAYRGAKVAEWPA